MAGIAAGRLAEERRAWRKDHPFGFAARPRVMPDGSTNLLLWDCKVPGKASTAWEGADFALTLEFSSDFPMKPPKARFTPPLFHLNCYPSGAPLVCSTGFPCTRNSVVCLSILDEEGWSAGTTVRQILLGIQEWFDTPNALSPAHGEAFALFSANRAAYEKRIREQAVARAAAGGGAS